MQLRAKILEFAELGGSNGWKQAGKGWIVKVDWLNQVSKNSIWQVSIAPGDVDRGYAMANARPSTAEAETPEEALVAALLLFGA